MNQCTIVVVNIKCKREQTINLNWKIYFLNFISRFIVIVLPMKSRSWCTSGNTHKILATVWIASIVLSSPAFYVMVQFTCYIKQRLYLFLIKQLHNYYLYVKLCKINLDEFFLLNHSYKYNFDKNYILCFCNIYVYLNVKETGIGRMFWLGNTT